MAKAPREARPEDPRVLQYWRPEKWELPEASAIQAIYAGNPTKDQCRHFVRWMEKATMLHAMTYSPLSDRDTAFAEGRRFVGRRFRLLGKINLALFRKKGDDVSENG